MLLAKSPARALPNLAGSREEVTAPPPTSTSIGLRAPSTAAPDDTVKLTTDNTGRTLGEANGRTVDYHTDWQPTHIHELARPTVRGSNWTSITTSITAWGEIGNQSFDVQFDNAAG